MLPVTQRDLKIYIKRGLGYTQICDKHQCSQTELEDAIKRIYDVRNVDKILKDIHKNTKLATKQLHQSSKTVGCESLRAQITELQRKLQSLNKQCENIATLDDTVMADITSLSGSIDTQIQLLEDIHQQINVLQVVTIFVYTDGQIEPVDGPSIMLDDTGSDILRQHLLENHAEQCEDLRLRDINTIARVQAITTNAQYPINPLFEDELLEEAHRKLQAPQKPPAL